MKKNTKANKTINSKKIADKKSAKIEVSAPKKRGRPRKNPDNAVVNVEKSVEKPMKKRIRKQMARKSIVKKTEKKIVNKKNLVKKPLNTKIKAKKISVKSNPNKDLFKQAKKLFSEARKNVSALKKTTKMYGKLLTSVLKSGDEKTISRVQKLFGYAGYTTVAGTGVTNTFVAKIKTPKIKSDIAKPNDNALVKPKRKYVHKANAQNLSSEDNVIVPEVEATKTIEQPIVSTVENEDVFKQPQVSEEPTEEEIAEIEDELNEDGNSSEDENDHDESEDDEFDVFKGVFMRDRSESDDEIYGAMRENGDID